MTFSVAEAFIKQALLVSDDDLRAAQQLLWDKLRLVAEPGGCAALAALLSRQHTPMDDEVVAVVISGANTTAVNFT